MTYPERFTDSWLRANVPTMRFGALLALERTLFDRGWTESEIRARVLVHRKVY